MEDENQSIDVWKPRGGVYRVECGTGGGVRRILPEEVGRFYVVVFLFRFIINVLTTVWDGMGWDMNGKVGPDKIFIF